MSTGDLDECDFVLWLVGSPRRTPFLIIANDGPCGEKWGKYIDI